MCPDLKTSIANICLITGDSVGPADDNPENGKKSKKLFRRILKYFLLLSLSVLILFCLLVYFLPGIASTDRVKDKIEARLTSALSRNVRIKSLKWTWKGGIKIEGLSIDNDPAFSNDPLLFLKNLEVKPGAVTFFPFYPSIDIKGQGFSLALYRDEEGKSSIDSMIPQSEEKTDHPPAEMKSAGNDGAEFSLPFDVRVTVDLENNSVLFSDDSLKQSFYAPDIDLYLNIPSIIKDPVTAALKIPDIPENRIIPPLDLKLTVKNAVSPDGRIDPQAAECSLKGALPGAVFEVSGSNGGEKTDGNININISPLTAIARPFAPSDMPEVLGQLEIEFSTSGDPLKAVDITLGVKGRDIALKNLPGSNADPGPFDFTFSNSMMFNVREGNLDNMKGSFSFLGDSSITWKGNVNAVYRGKPDLDISVGPVSLNLDKAVSAVEGFIPEGIYWNRNRLAGHSGDSKKTPEGAGAISLSEVLVKGSLDKGAFNILLKRFRLSLPPLSLDLPDGSINTGESEVIVPEADVRIDSLFPVSASISAGIDIKGVCLSGKKDLCAGDIKLPSIVIKAHDIKQSEGSFAGITGKLSVDQTLKVHNIDIPEVINIPEIEQSFYTDLRLEEGIPLSATGLNMSLFIPSLTVSEISDKPLETDLKLKSSIGSVMLKDIEALSVDVRESRVRLLLRDMIDSSIEFSVEDSGKRGIDLKGKTDVNMGSITGFLPEELTGGNKANGAMSLSWEYDGLLPEPDTFELLKNKNPGPDKLIEYTSFIRMFKASLSLKDIEINAVSEGRQFAGLSGIRTTRPAGIILKEGLKYIEMDGGLFLGRFTGSILREQQDLPLDMSLSFNMTQTDLNRFNFKESMDSSLFNLRQTLDVDISDIRKLFPYISGDVIRGVFEKINGSAAFKMDMEPDENINGFVEGINSNGVIHTWSKVFLAGGERLEIKSGFDITDMNAGMDGLFNVKGLNVRFPLEKTWSIILPGTVPIEDRGSFIPLSTDIMHPDSKVGLREKANDVPRRIVDDLKSTAGNMQAVSFTSANILSGPVPLEVKNHEASISLNKGLPSVDYIQLDIMDGTIAGSVISAKEDSRFFIEGKLALSGIDTASLTEKEKKREDEDDTEISGTLSYRLPVSSNAGSILQELEIKADITHIGARTLERLLYALDPYESNEAIVSQRKLLSIGTPGWVVIEIKDGSLSLKGQVIVKGIGIDMPGIERLNLTGLPIGDMLNENLKDIDSINGLLKMISSDKIAIGDDSIGLK